ncbi:MAG: GGDEF domain-containing protein [Lachnospiraceae bacterium]|nr:GGDEF domain-containing protein [Lachnospiraceae bacterium]
MDDLFGREQKIFDNALAYLQEVEEKSVILETAKFKRIVTEYGRLLKQFRKITNISDKSANELRSKTLRDALTGLFNRRFLDNGLETYIQELAGTKEALSVLMIDIDCFKDYNDTYGHNAGDDCLKLVADTLEFSLRAGDGFAARYGGEEFTIVLPRADESGAKVVAERLLKRVRELKIPHSKSSVTDIVTVSIGITSGIAEKVQSASEYTKRADEALYISKRGGRNQYTYLHFKEEEKI